MDFKRADSADFVSVIDHKRITLPAGFEYPNGIAYLPNGELLLGSVSQPRLLHLNQQGELIGELDTSAALYAGTALRFDMHTNLLWVASPDFLGLAGQKRRHRVGVVDVARGEVIAVTELPEGGFGNDFVLDGAGGAYLTDSLLGKVYHIAKPGAALKQVADLGAVKPGELGPAGITRLPAGEGKQPLLVGSYTSGELKLIAPDNSAMAKTLVTSRSLENPDGILWYGPRQALVVEGAVHSGDGSLTRLVFKDDDVEVETLLSGLDTPVNLALWHHRLAISEADIRHVMLPQSGRAQPEQFYLTMATLADGGDSTSAQTPVAALPKGWYSESIAQDSQGRIYAASAMHSAIAVFDPAQGSTRVFAGGPELALNSVQGLYIDENSGAGESGRLYACTAELGLHKLPNFKSSLLAFDLATAELLGRWPLPGDGLCNDITAFGARDLLVTETTGHRVLRFNRASQTFTPWLSGGLLQQGQFGPNGIAYSAPDAAVYITLFQAGGLLKVSLGNDMQAQAVVQVKLPQAMNGPDAVRSLGKNRVLVFENGLVQGGGGALTTIAIEGDLGRPATLLDSQANPTSGVISGDSVLFVESYFKDLFVDAKPRDDREFTVQRLLLPQGFQ